MGAPAALDEITCPACGNEFRLSDKVADYLRQGWAKTERSRLKTELLKSAEFKRQIEKQADKTVRAKEEELRERDKQISRLKTQVTKLQKALPAGRAQSLGDLRQASLADQLSSLFPADRIEMVPRGVAGGDIIQRVVDGAGQLCGTILWESKRTTAWNSAWLSKLKGDKRRGHHDLAVIVSEARLEEDRHLQEVDGVWVASFEVATDLASVLREQLTQVSRAHAVNDRREDFKGKAFDYLNGPLFSEHVQAVVETAHGLRQSLDKERGAHEKEWATRGERIRTLIEEMARLSGEAQAMGAPPTVTDLEIGDRPALPESA